MTQSQKLKPAHYEMNISEYERRIEMLDFSDFKKIAPLRFDGASYKYAVQGNDAIYILKFEEYPRQNISMSHTNHHISEYIGSHIYQSIGLPTQETFLVKRNNKVAVACKNFCGENTRLYSFKELATDFMHPSISGSSTSSTVTTLEDTLSLFSTQTIFPADELSTRYWDMFVVDSFIANPDRHNGNWGYLVNTKTFEVSLAPVYDCGSSLYPVIPEEMMISYLANSTNLKTLAINEPCSTIRYNGAKISFLDFYRNYKNPDLIQAVKRIVPQINMERVADIVNNTPTISSIHKNFLLELLTMRKELLLDPALKRILKNEKSPTINISKPTGKGLER